jgi:lauroyl/myristoyl acyltransferase
MRSHSPSLEEALADVEMPRAHLLQLGDRRSALNPYTWPALHRALPKVLAAALARLRARVEMAVPRRRRRALERAALAMGKPAPARECRRLAREQLAAAAITTELSWRPGDGRDMPVDGLENFDLAESSGRGVILATVHAGPMLHLVHALAARGHKVYLSGGRRPHEKPPTGYYGRWVIFQNRWIEEAGCRWVWRGGSYPVLRALLERGKTCYLAFDVIGDVDVRLGGRTAHITSGPAALAIETGAVIVPALVILDGRRPRGKLLAPVAPSGALDEQALTLQVAELLEPEVTARLEQLNAQHYAELWTGDRVRWAASNV